MKVNNNLIKMHAILFVFDRCLTCLKLFNLLKIVSTKYFLLTEMYLKNFKKTNLLSRNDYMHILKLVFNEIFIESIEVLQQ